MTKNDVFLFEKLIEANYAGDEDYEIDEDLTNILLAEQNITNADNQDPLALMRQFIKAHLICMVSGRRFDDKEHEILQMLTDQGDEIVFGAYECYSLTKNEEELVETLRQLVELEIDEEEMDCNSSPNNESQKRGESKRDEYQRDSWPCGFEKMVDRSKASKILEQFKDMMSSVKYSILQSVDSIYLGHREGRTIFHGLDLVLIFDPKKSRRIRIVQEVFDELCGR